jgi:phosphoribosyl-AMP cyclohydrolase / phosphoribosyl-ATP pyrophosphohydrolase
VSATAAAPGPAPRPAPEAVPLSKEGLEALDFEKDGLIPAVVQDLHTREVLMVGFTNKDMVERTLETGNAWFWTRSKARPWLKGETSGNFIRVREVRRNCYDNSLLYLSEPVGPVCHTDEVGCYYRRLDGSKVEIEASYAPHTSTDAGTGAADQGSAPTPASSHDPARSRASHAGDLEWLWAVIQQRVRDRPEGSYPVRLLDQGTDRVLKKVGEEAGEVIIAAKNRAKDELAAEMADLWFHTLLVLQDAGMSPDDVFQVLAGRHTVQPKGAAGR